MPADAPASDVVDSTLAAPVAAAAALGSALHASGDFGSESGVLGFAQWRRAAMRFPTWYFCGLVQVPTAASSAAVLDVLHRRHSPQKVPSNAWLDTTESIPLDGDRHAQPTGAAT